MKKILFVVLWIVFGGKAFAQNGTMSDDVYEYTGELFTIMNDRGNRINYRCDYSIWMKLPVGGSCSFDMEVEIYAVALHFEGSAYYEKGAGWFKGLLDICERKNRRRENVYFFWNKHLDDWSIYKSSNDQELFEFCRNGEW